MPSRRAGAARSSPCRRRRAAQAARARQPPRGRCESPPPRGRRDASASSRSYSRRHLAFDQFELFESREDERGRLGGRPPPRVPSQLPVRGGLVRVVDTGEVLDLACHCPLVEALGVALCAHLEWRRDMDLDERRLLLDRCTGRAAGLLVRGDRAHDDCRASAREPRCDPADPEDVRVAVVLGEAEALREMGADDVTVEALDGAAARLELARHQRADGRLPRRREPGEPENKATAHETISWTSADLTVWMPHSTLPVPAQRPDRPAPGCVECVSPIESYP